LLLGMTILLVFHAQIEHAAGLEENSMLLGAAVSAGAAALLLSGRKAGELLRRRIDWATLAFFLMLFILVGALDASGVTGVAATAIERVSGGHPAAMVLAIGWTTGIISAFLANLLAVAAFLPVVAQLKAHGATCPTAVYWMMLFGACFMGNMTSIGSTCNIIACSMAETRGNQTLRFSSWLKIGIVVSFASMLAATLLLAVQTHWLTTG